MALYSVSTGGTILALDLDQFLNLLTGVMTDQPVSLARVLSAGAALLFPQVSAAPPSGAGFAGGMRLSFYGSPTTDQGSYGMGIDSSTLWYVSAGGTHKWYGASGTALMAISTAGLNLQGYPLPNCGAITTASLASSGAVSGTTGTFSGAVQSNSHPVVEGTAAVSHAEVLPPQGSLGGLNNNQYATVTLTFARTFSAAPAVSGSAATSAGNKGSIGTGSSVGTTSATMYFQNLDSNTQTISNWSIMALGV